MNENNTHEISENNAPVLPAITKSREVTQCNALDTAKLTAQVMTMSGSSSHEKLVDEILADKTISISEKVDLVHRENDAYDARVHKNSERQIKMQAAQTKNVRRADTWFVAGFTFTVAGVIYYLRTPEGQKALSSFSTSITKFLAA